MIQAAPDPDAGNTPRVVTALAHTHDNRHRRDSARREDGTKWTYGYNECSEVTAAAKHLPNSALVPGLDFGYSYDGLGNRLTARKGNPALITGYTPDAMNRYETITTPGGDDILVRSDAPVTITADGQPTTQTTAGNFHNGRATIDNDPDGAWTEINVSATGFNHTGHRWIPPATVSPHYDTDGNLLNDGRWSYTWDAMNRLTGLTPTANALIAGVPNETITYAYDHLSRRIGKKVVTTGGETSTTKETRYLYDGWNVVAEFTVENGVLVPSATYLWSQDLSGSLQGAGGVGGLHSVSLLPAGSGASIFLPSYDANGNIIAWTDTSGRVAQRQDYDPFGNLVVLERHSIDIVTSARLTYGFSTKPLEAESGFHYYGYRFYDGRNGRWINRDPIEEDGGVNLYGFLGNSAVWAVDLFGNSPLAPLPAASTYVGDGSSWDMNTWEDNTLSKVTIERLLYENNAILTDAASLSGLYNAAEQKLLPVFDKVGTATYVNEADGAAFSRRFGFSLLELHPNNRSSILAHELVHAYNYHQKNGVKFGGEDDEGMGYGIQFYYDKHQRLHDMEEMLLAHSGSSFSYREIVAEAVGFSWREVWDSFRVGANLPPKEIFGVSMVGVERDYRLLDEILGIRFTCEELANYYNDSPALKGKCIRVICKPVPSDGPPRRDLEDGWLELGLHAELRPYWLKK